jgi:anti-sigma regulatory factor (Ser/Thr protein kinase)
MHFEFHRSFILEERSYAGVIKREIKSLAESVGFKEKALAEIEIVLSEIISNLLKHARGTREILVKAIDGGGQGLGIEIIAIDDGPGIRDINRSMQDGVSTAAGSLGLGLGAIKRLSSDFGIYSLADWGTIILSRLYLIKEKKYTRPPAFADPRAIIVPKPDESRCGDGWMFKKKGDVYRVLAVDGLGHGPGAENATKEAKLALEQDTSALPSESLAYMHERLRKTRGVVAAMIDYDTKANTAVYCGVGNINTRVVSYTVNKTVVSYNGILGMNRPGILHDRKVDLDESGCIIITSDGIRTRWDGLNNYPGIMRQDSSVIAAAIYKDNVRRTDDALVVVFAIKS